MFNELECLMEDDKPIPSPSSPKSLSVSAEDFAAMVSIDILKIKDNASGKAVKKTLTIPAWLNEEAEKYHINFSSVLKEALIEKISE